jgi:hypothetical protein
MSMRVFFFFPCCCWWWWYIYPVPAAAAAPPAGGGQRRLDLSFSFAQTEEEEGKTAYNACLGLSV